MDDDDADDVITSSALLFDMINSKSGYISYGIDVLALYIRTENINKQVREL